MSMRKMVPGRVERLRHQQMPVFHDKLLISLVKALRYVCSSSSEMPAL